mgnify:CR=1 FL=1
MIDNNFFIEEKSSFIKSHKCSGNIEQRYSKLLNEKIKQYEQFLETYFDVGDISYINIFKQKFGFLTEDSTTFKGLMENFKFQEIISSEKIIFIANAVSYNNQRILIATWDNKEHSLYYPKYFILSREKSFLF